MSKVTCSVCHTAMKIIGKRIFEESIVYSWQCPKCGSYRQTRRTGVRFRYQIDKEFREAEKKRRREYYRKYGK